jgi:hypothetical protein
MIPMGGGGIPMGGGGIPMGGGGIPMGGGGSFGANPLRRTIGLGKASQIVKLEIYWSTTDTTQTFSNVPLDTVIHITEGKPQFEQLQPRSFGP